MHYRVTLADALTAHDKALTFGGRDGISSLHLIESALGRPYSGYHRTIAAKCAALLESMVGNHGFVDGNKRTAWLLVELLVARSRYELTLAKDEPVDDFVVAVAEGKIAFPQMENWFVQRLRKRQSA
jgi:death-on-curing protein